MKKILCLIIVLLVAVLMTQMRPDKQAHKAAMMKAVREYVDEEYATHRDNVVTRLQKNAIVKAVEVALNTKLRLDDYYLFNTTHVRMGDEDKLLSVGLLGQVITFNKDMLRETLEESAREKAEAKQAEREAKQAQRDARRAEKQQAKEQKRKAKEERKAQKRREKEEKKRQGKN